MNLETAKQTVKLEIESLIAQCYREVANLESYSDERMLIATADLQYHLDKVIEASQELEDARDAVIEAEEMVSCAKCGLRIEIHGEDTLEDEDIEGSTWYYCSEDCRERH